MIDYLFDISDKIKIYLFDKHFYNKLNNIK